MRRIWWPMVAVATALLAGCGPWIIEQPPPMPTAEPSPSSPDEAARARLAAIWELDPRAIVSTADGFVFVVRAPAGDDELHLLLSRAAESEHLDILARVETPSIPEGVSGGGSFAVVCPENAGLEVRHYLFGQDTREVTRVMEGLTALGGEVVDGLWVLAITDDEIAPDQPWRIVDPLGMAPMESGTGRLFQADGETAGDPGDLCQVTH